MKLSDAEAIYVGGQPAEAAYVGSELVWPSAPPIGCTITLTGDFGPAAGFAAADTSGNSFSVTDAVAGVYLASTPFAAAGVRRQMPAAGKKVWIQGDSFYTSGGDGTNVRAGFYAFDGAGNAIALVQLNGVTLVSEGIVVGVSATSPAGAQLAVAGLPQDFSAYASLGVGDDGALYIYDPVAESVVALASLNEDFDGLLTGASTLVLIGMCDLSGGGPASAGARIVTNQADMIDRAALAGDEDWCGNDIVPQAPVWTPDAMAVLAGANGFEIVEQEEAE